MPKGIGYGKYSGKDKIAGTPIERPIPPNAKTKIFPKTNKIGGKNPRRMRRGG